MSAEENSTTAERTVARPVATSSTVSSNSETAMLSAEWKLPIIADVVSVAHPVGNNVTKTSLPPGAILQQMEQLNIAVRSGQSRKASSVLADRNVVVELTRPPANSSIAVSGDPSTVTTSHESKRTKTASGPNPSSRDAGVQMKYPPINSCPICQLPIPVEASSPDAFARHVDQCLTRVTRREPAPPPSSALAARPRVDSNDPRVCPMCFRRFPADKFTVNEFEQHVNNHFNDPITVNDEFVVINK